jgi:hypothetical protein
MNQLQTGGAFLRGLLEKKGAPRTIGLEPHFPISKLPLLGAYPIFKLRTHPKDHCRCYVGEKIAGIKWKPKDA